MNLLILRWLALSIFLFQPIVVSLYSQDEDRYEAPGKIYIISEFGLVVGNVISIDVGPAVGYHLTERISAGIGGRYEFFRKIDDFTREELIRTDIFGGRVFTRALLVPDLRDIIPFNIPLGIVAQAEFEVLSLENEAFGSDPDITEGRFWYPAILAGGGITQQTSERSYMNFLVLWELTNSSNSPYFNPLIRFGFQIYF